MRQSDFTDISQNAGYIQSVYKFIYFKILTVFFKSDIINYQKSYAKSKKCSVFIIKLLKITGVFIKFVV